MSSTTKWKMATAIVVLMAAGALGFQSNSPATAATGGPDDDGLILLTSGQTIAAGATFNGVAGNLAAQVFQVQPFPTSPSGCRMITTKEEVIAQGGGLRSLFWEVKNIGTTSCSFTVLLAFTS